MGDQSIREALGVVEHMEGDLKTTMQFIMTKLEAHGETLRDVSKLDARLDARMEAQHQQIGARLEAQHQQMMDMMKTLSSQQVLATQPPLSQPTPPHATFPAGLAGQTGVTGISTAAAGQATATGPPVLTPIGVATTPAATATTLRIPQFAPNTLPHFRVTAPAVIQQSTPTVTQQLGPTATTEAAADAGATNQPHQTTMISAKRKIILPSLRLPTTTLDFEGWQTALYNYIAELEAGDRVITEDMKISEAKKMVANHQGRNAYYHQVQQWRSSEPTLERFLRVLKGWHLVYTDTHQKHTIQDAPLIADGVFDRPIGRDIRDWVVSPRVIEALRTDYDIWPRPSCRVGGFINSLACQVCHYMALEEFLFDKSKPRGKFGSQYDIDRILARFDTPNDLLQYLVDWVHKNPLLEKEFMEKKKKQLAHWRTMDEQHYSNPGTATPTAKTVMAYGHSPTGPATGPNRSKFKGPKSRGTPPPPTSHPPGGGSVGGTASPKPKAAAGAVDSGPSGPGSTSSGKGKGGKPCFLCRVVNPADTAVHKIEDCPHFSREAKNVEKAAKS